MIFDCSCLGISFFGSEVFFLRFIYICIYLLALMGLHCDKRVFSSHGEQGYSSLQPSHCDGPSCCGSRALGTQASVAAAQGP